MVYEDWGIMWLIFCKYSKNSNCTKIFYLKIVIVTWGNFKYLKIFWVSVSGTPRNISTIDVYYEVKFHQLIAQNLLNALPNLLVWLHD